MSYPALIALFGATQGFLLGLVLSTQTSGKHTANRILALFILAESLRLFLLAFTYGYFLPRPELYALLNITLCLGPLLYFYVLALTLPRFSLRISMAWHFLPALVLMVASAQWLHGAAETDWQTDPKLSGSLAYFFWSSISPILGFISLLVYAALSSRLIPPYKKLLAEQFSALEHINLNWLRVLILFCLATAAISALVETLRLLTTAQLGPRIMVSLAMSVAMLYAIGFMGMRQPRIFNQREGRVFDQHRNVNRNPGEQPADPDKPVAKYQKSGLSDIESDILWEKLKHMMVDEQPYLQNGLKLTQLADMLDVVPNHLSQIINSQSGQSFFDFINEYRVQRACELLRDPTQTHVPIAHLALEAGFNSQNAFYNQFRKRVGTTPAKFRKNDK